MVKKPGIKFVENFCKNTKGIMVKATHYEIYVSKYFLFGKKTRAVSGNMRNNFSLGFTLFPRHPRALIFWSWKGIFKVKLYFSSAQN